MDQGNGAMLATGLSSATPPDSNLAKHQLAANASPQVKQLMKLQAGANQAMQLQSAPIQRRVKKFNEDASNVSQNHIDAAKQVADLVDQLATTMRAVALDWESFENESGYLGTWYKTAKSYAESSFEEDIDFVHARFGYAIETLVSKTLNAKEYGLNVDLQVASGHTRPDIVLTLDDKTVVAWLDITSEGSKGHVKKKDSTGWKTHPYVAEILYDALDPKEILTGGSNPINKLKGEYFKEKVENRDQSYSEVKKEMKDKVKSIATTHSFSNPHGNQSEKKELVKREFNTAFGSSFLGGNTNQIAKGTLSGLEFNPGHFGFKGGKESSEGLNTYIRKNGQSKWDLRNQESVDTRSKKVKMDLEEFNYFPQVEQFSQMTTNKEMDEKSLLQGYIRQGMLKAKDELFGLGLNLSKFGKISGADSVKNDVLKQMSKMDNCNSDEEIEKWTKEAVKLAKMVKEFISSLEQELTEEESCELDFKEY